MNRLFVFSVAVTLMAFSSCRKSLTKEGPNAGQGADSERKKSDAQPDEKALDEKDAVTGKIKSHRSSAPVTQTNGAAGNSPIASYSTFYTRLQPYGVWRDTADYGYVWQPDVAERSRDWRPYTMGRWVYTDVGWMWVSEEPFGWATYHYGRWTRLRHIGWVWVPGDEWAPAWVSWRKSDNYIGWAPLPPEARFDRRVGIRNWADNYYEIGPDQYCFVFTRQFGAQRVSPTVISPDQNVTIVNQTTNVTNITYNNTTIVNQGPDYYELRMRTQQPIEHLRVERHNALKPDDDPSAVVRGEVIEVAAPKITRAASVERPEQIKERVSRTSVDLGWHGVTDLQAADKARAKIRSESTPPPDAPSKAFERDHSFDESNPPKTVSTSAPLVMPVKSPASASPKATESVSQQAEAGPGLQLSLTPTAAESPTPSPTPRLTPAPTARPTPTPSPTPTPRPTPTAIPTPKPVPSPSPSPSVRPALQAREEQEEKKGVDKRPNKKEPGKPKRKPSPTPTPAGKKWIIH